MTSIINRHTSVVIAEGDGKSVRQLVIENWDNLSEADLSGADLSGADLRRADLSDADLRRADLSGAVGILTAAEYLAQFEQDRLGVLVYKRIGETQYKAPNRWEVKEGAFISEVVNKTVTQECGCGVNFGTRKWCDEYYLRADLWLCRIHWLDLADVVVPYNSDGKARCARLELVKKVED